MRARLIHDLHTHARAVGGVLGQAGTIVSILGFRILACGKADFDILRLPVSDAYSPLPERCDKDEWRRCIRDENRAIRAQATRNVERDLLPRRPNVSGLT